MAYKSTSKYLVGDPDLIAKKQMHTERGRHLIVGLEGGV